MRTRRFAIAFAVVALAAMIVPMSAMANAAIHGNYVTDTDACAGCHRAHTSASTLTWSDTVDATEHSALLVTSATRMEQFCYACHDATSQGAYTNVEQGFYEDPADTFGTYGSVLNGGAFGPLAENVALADPSEIPTSRHTTNGQSWGAYGGGFFGGRDTNLPKYPDGTAGIDPVTGDAMATGESTPVKMDCATCHDPHGSANYRILKSYVNGNYVGGYQPSGDPLNPTPDAWVQSAEVGFPVGGFLLHSANAGYVPNYTQALYAKAPDGPDADLLPDTDKGMSGWCAGCHQTYLRPTEVMTKTVGGVESTYTASGSIYDAGDGMGLKLRHRHPINVELNSYNGPDKVAMNIGGLSALNIAVAHDVSEAGAVTETASDWVECLTCHRAHGTFAVMTGYAADGSLAKDTDGISKNNFVANPSALLRRDNRGVCEGCHNK